MGWHFLDRIGDGVILSLFALKDLTYYIVAKKLVWHNRNIRIEHTFLAINGQIKNWIIKAITPLDNVYVLFKVHNAYLHTNKEWFKKPQKPGCGLPSDNIVQLIYVFRSFKSYIQYTTCFNIYILHLPWLFKLSRAPFSPPLQCIWWETF